MKIPPNYTEEQVLKIIDEVSSKLAYKFKFGYHEVEDIKQTACLLAIEVLDSGKYDSSRPLANFLYIHIKNRLSNLKRNTYERLEKPCDKCPMKAYIKKEGKCQIYENMQDCQLYADWFKRNTAKKCLMHGENLEGDLTPSHRRLGNGDEELRAKEMEDYINVNLPVEYRIDYLKLRHGQKLSPQRREVIEDLVMEILENGGYIL